MQTNQYQEIEKNITKKIYFEFLSLLPTKNGKIDTKHSILGNRGTLRVYYSSKEQKDEKRKNMCIWRSFLDIKMLKLMNNTLN